MSPILNPPGNKAGDDSAVTVNQDVRGNCYIATVQAAPFMHQTVSLNDLALNIAKDCELEPVALHDPAGVLRPIDGHGQQPPAHATEFFVYFSETSEFRKAQRSPMPAIEYQQHRPLGQRAFKGYQLTRVIEEREIGSRIELGSRAGDGQGCKPEEQV